MHFQSSAIEELLESIHQISKQHHVGPTIFEITGYPHLEKVSSNILAFYLQSNDYHGFGDSLFRALSLAANLPLNMQNVKYIETRTEESTVENKRIDIILETENILLGIENKIYHDLHNDLAAYWKHLESNARGRNVVGIVLSLEPIVGFSNVNFQNITYESLFVEFEKLVPEIDRFNRYQIFFQDFICNIRNLARRTYMEKDKIAFFKNFAQEIDDLLIEVKELRQYMRQRLDSLADRLQLEYKNANIQKSYWKPSHAVMDFLNYEIEIEPQIALQIDLCISLAGWRMQFWNPRGSLQCAQNIIDTCKISYHVQSTPFRRLVYAGDCPPFDAEIEHLADWSMSAIQLIIDKINE